MSSILKTLDSKHQEYLSEFEWIEQQRIPELQKIINQNETKIKKLKQKGKHTIDQQMELYDEIQKSKKKNKNPNR